MAIKTKEINSALATFKKQLQVHIDIIAKERDKMRTLIEDAEEILSTVDDALDEFDCVQDNLRAGIDKLSELL